MNVIQYIQALAAKGQTQQAIAQLLEITEKTPYHNQAIMLSASFHSHHNDLALKTVEQQNIEKARLVYSITHLIENLEGVLSTEIMAKEYTINPPATKTSLPSSENTVSSSTTKRILFMSANPEETTRLNLGMEVRKIKDSLTASQHRKQFEFHQEDAVTTQIIRRNFLENPPQIVHFSGHGGEDNGLNEGIVVNDDLGNTVVLSTKALDMLFESVKNQVQCVVLNACYSEVQAQAIKNHIPYVVGMNDAIEDSTAITFSMGFYEAVGAGKSYPEAFNNGKLAIVMDGKEGADIPKLLE